MTDSEAGVSPGVPHPTSCSLWSKLWPAAPALGLRSPPGSLPGCPAEAEPSWCPHSPQGLPLVSRLQRVSSAHLLPSTVHEHPEGCDMPGGFPSSAPGSSGLREGQLSGCAQELEGGPAAATGTGAWHPSQDPACSGDLLWGRRGDRHWRCSTIHPQALQRGPPERLRDQLCLCLVRSSWGEGPRRTARGCMPPMWWLRAPGSVRGRPWVSDSVF